MSTDKVSIFWFRRDLRLEDNRGLHHALKGEHLVLPVFIFDTAILNRLANPKDARVSFIHQELSSIQEALVAKGSSLLVEYGEPLEIWEELTKTYSIAKVYTNRDYEPYARKRDGAVSNLLAAKGIDLLTYKDHVIFEGNEVVKKDGSPYLVYTPYSKKWMSQIEEKDFEEYPSALESENWWQSMEIKIPALSDMGFAQSDLEIPARKLADRTMETYADERDIPSKDSTSRLGLHLRFGTVSTRAIARRASKISEIFYKELIWREFFIMILYHFPHVVDRNYSSKYDRVEWRNNEEEFKRWCEGKTGFPMVDAGMRELNETGFMHNRVRMITANFLCKILLIDWRWGEAYFAEKLLDFELASNNGNWQWSAGTGVDAAPYFRIFNPETQIDRFDKQKLYIRKWIPEYGSSKYPQPMVDYKMARQRAMDTYKRGLDGV